MRQSLQDLIEKTVVLEYHLPHSSKSISAAKISTDHDHCYSAYDTESLKEIIYNALIDFSFNEYDIDPDDYANLHARALETKIKYDSNAEDLEKSKYGFYGEILLFSILQVIYGTKPIIARGYFYSPLENSEPKGYDAYHLVEHNDTVELWFGEAKFYKNYKAAINSVLGAEDASKGLQSGWKLEKVLSKKYLSKNLLAIIDNNKNNLNIDTKNSVVGKLIDAWRSNPQIVLAEELEKYNVKFVYPIFLLYEGEKDYDASIKKIPEYVDQVHDTLKSDLSIDFSLFFILLPVDDVGGIKRDVISWIESKKELMS